MMTTKEKVREIIEKLSGRLFLHEKNGQYIYSIAPCYGDYIGPDTIPVLCAADEPLEALEEWVEEQYALTVARIRKMVIDHVLDAYPEEDEEEVIDEVIEQLGFEYPYDHFQKQTMRVNVVVDTGDGPYNFVLNTVWPRDHIQKEASLVWLAGQQGYSYEELDAALSKEGVPELTGFLKTVREEVLNLASTRNELTFLVTMTVQFILEVCALRKKQKEPTEQMEEGNGENGHLLRIPKETTTGLYDPNTGGGSLFEIGLEKDILLPVRYIHSALPSAVIKGEWTIERAYGMSGQAWQAEAELIKQEDKT